MEVQRWRSGPDPQVSVVMATVPDTDHEPVVETLRSQHFEGSWEVIVVTDDEPTDRRCAARNLGLERADADIVAHTDDDVEPPRDWVARVHEAFDPDTVCVEGRVEGGLEYEGTGLYVGCNLAVRRAPALAVGGWNEEYAGWRDDTEFGWRLEVETAGRCRYDGDMLMRHPPLPRTRFRADQERRLRETYPDRYAERIVGDWRSRALLFLQKRGWDRYLLRLLP